MGDVAREGKLALEGDWGAGERQGGMCYPGQILTDGGSCGGMRGREEGRGVDGEGVGGPVGDEGAEGVVGVEGEVAAEGVVGVEGEGPGGEVAAEGVEGEGPGGEVAAEVAGTGSSPDTR